MLTPQAIRICAICESVVNLIKFKMRLSESKFLCSKLDDAQYRLGNVQDKAYLQNESPQIQDTVLKISIFENGLVFFDDKNTITSKKSTHYNRLFQPRS